MKHPKRLLILVLVLLALVAAVVFALRPRPAASGDEAKSDAAAPRPALTVTVAAPQPAELNQTLAANGNIAAWQEASIGAELNGQRLTEVRVNVGDSVKKGQVLAVFSAETVNADVAQARASLAEAEAAAADAAGNAERARTLQQTGALSQQQINQYQTAAKTARARVEAARAVLSAQQVRGRNTQVLAPDAGVISARSATVGSVSAAGSELFRLIRGGRLEWRAELPSAELGRVAVGTPVRVTAASGEQVSGTVRAIAPTVDARTRAALVYVDLPGALQQGGVKAGMFAQGEFQLGRSAALTVPQAAIVPRDGFNYVLLLQASQQVALRKVETGRRVGDRVEINGELPADARVVVEGAGFLNDGDRVRVVEPAVAGPTPASAGNSVPNKPPAPENRAPDAIK